MPEGEPQVIATIDGYVCNWPSQALKITVNRLHAHNDGRVTAEISITTSRNGYTGKLYPATSFNFASMQTRERLINLLTKQYEEWAWPGIISQLCEKVLDAARAGEEVEELWTSDKLEPPKLLIAPIIFEGLPTVVFGEKETNKSLTSLLVYTMCSVPQEDSLMGLGFGLPQAPISALYLDWEVNKSVAIYNLSRICKGMGLPSIPLHYRRCLMPLASDLSEIHRLVEKWGAKLVIVDSLARAVGKKLDEESANQFTEALAKIGCASYIIAQTSKSEDKTKTVLGSTLFQYFARAVFELRKDKYSEEDDPDTAHVALFCTHYNLGRHPRPLGLRIKYTEDAITFENEEVKSVAAFIARLGLQTQILDLLKHGALPVKDIASQLESKETAVRMALSRLKAKGQVTKTTNGYGLAILEGTNNDVTG